MAFIIDRVFDEGLGPVLDIETDRLDVTNSEATSFADATTNDGAGGSSLGTKLTPTVNVPEDRTPDGRKVVVAAITDGTVNVTGTASHWAVTDTINSRLLATGTLSTPQAVTASNTFTLTAFDIGIPDA